MLYDIFQQYKKQIVALLVAFVLILLGVLGYQLYTLQTQQGKAAVAVVSIPDDATITVGSQTVKPGVTYLSPGIYSVKAHKDGFSDFTLDFRVVDTSPSVLNIQLLAASSEAKKWVDDHQALYLESEARGGEAAARASQEFQQTNPITKKLPYSTPYFSIGYKSPDNKTISLTITAVSALYRYQALQKLREWGYDPSDFTILYTNYESPLE